MTVFEFERRLAAVFFIPRSGDPLPLPRLVAAAGMTGISEDERSPGMLRGWWAGMDDCRARADSFSQHDCLQIHFWLADFPVSTPGHTAGEDRSWVDDPAAAVASAFRDACETLKPEVAFILTHLGQARPERIEEYYRFILGMDADRLMLQKPGLLYFSRALFRELSDPSTLASRDTIPASDGVLVFSGSGESRWW